MIVALNVDLQRYNNLKQTIKYHVNDFKNCHKEKCHAPPAHISPINFSHLATRS